MYSEGFLQQRCIKCSIVSEQMPYWHWYAFEKRQKIFMFGSNKREMVVIPNLSIFNIKEIQLFCVMSMMMEEMKGLDKLFYEYHRYCRLSYYCDVI